MTYLLAGGDSFTSDHYKGLTNDTPITWPTWPSIVGKRMGFAKRDIINTAEPGMSNDAIFTSIFDTIYEKGNPEVIIIMLSQLHRSSLYNYSNWSNIPNYYCGMYVGLNVEDKPDEFPFFSKYLLDEREKKIRSLKGHDVLGTITNAMMSVGIRSYLDIPIDSVINNTLRPLWQLVQYCVNNKIKLFVGQGLLLFTPLIQTIELKKYFTRGDNFEIYHTRRFPTLLDCDSLEAIDEYMNKNQYYNLLSNIDQTSSYSNIHHCWPIHTVKDIVTQVILNEMKTTKCDFQTASKKYRLSDADGHPSASGQEMMADWFWERIAGIRS